jgi:diguanylate cyclase (GGDEF)-like protein
MHSFTQTIEGQTERIIAHWREWLKRSGTSIADPEAFSQAARPALAEIAARVDALLDQTDPAEAQARWWPQSSLMPAVRAYAASRRAAGAEAILIAREWQLLRAALWHALAEEFGQVSGHLVELQVILNYAFDDALAQAAVAQHLFEMRTSHDQTYAAARAAFNQQLAAEVERAARYSRACSISIIDINHLRNVNEKLGRKKGDRVVKELASILQSQLRQADRTFRYGGDEFVTIMPETDFEAASVVLSRIGERAARFCQESKLPPEVTISWGIASFPHDSEEAKSLFLLADNRLREHKRRAAQKPATRARAADATARLD